MDTPARFQVEFLGKIQRLLSDGMFTASYKYALLRALADIAVETGAADGSPLEINTRQIAEKFATYYWRQVVQLPVNDGLLLLKQNTGQPAAVLMLVAEFRDKHSGLFARAKNSKDWPRLISGIETIVKKQPLWKLQTTANQSDDFLYKNLGSGNLITLRPHVAFCLRTFHGLIVDLVQNSWLNYIRKTNQQELGRTVDLVEFLFGSDRKDLTKLEAPLTQLQNSKCFYCHASLRVESDVDHFVPWSRYAVDLGHNFVVAHPTCNRSKSDHLASMDHLKRWVDFTASNQMKLAGIAEEAQIPHDFDVSCEIVQWAYTNAARLNGSGWHKAKEFQAIDYSFFQFFD